MHDEYELLIFLAVSLVLALFLGLLTERLRLSPIVGYLLAGIALGPQTPGFVGDRETAQQLADVGVILLMFGVGLHFDLRDLWEVRRVALPGATAKTLVATALGALAAGALGWGATESLIIGIAVSVASTVVLIRILVDNDALHTPQGHLAVGWLIVEDILTVLVLVALPAVAGVVRGGGEGAPSVLLSLGKSLLLMTLLGALVLGGGRRLIPWLLGLVARTRSRELFTLSVLAIAMAIAVGSYFFGVSIVLGAFLAGMVVGQTEVSHQAAADALPMRDAFAVLFFVSIGMLFDVHAIGDHPILLLLLVLVVIVAKPLTAFVILWLYRYTFRTAATVAIALGQMGEFSFLLAQEAMRHQLLNEWGQSLIVACAIISITLNPLMFRAIAPLEQWLRARPESWRLINARAEARGAQLNAECEAHLQKENGDATGASAVIIGYGPVGQTAARILKDFNVQPVVVDLNLDTIRDLAAADKLGVYGDATRRDILKAAGIERAKYLLVTIPDVLTRTLIIITAKEINPELKIFVRARYLKERAWLEEVGATQLVTEEGETALGLAVLMLREVGADEQRIREEIRRIQTELGVHTPEEDHFRPHYSIQQDSGK